MAHIEGALHAEALGLPDAPPMVFVHPNPMDASTWLYQTAHFSTWFRCVAVDLPGYGRSPRASEGLTMVDIADACWEAVDAHATDDRAVLVGCSVGGAVVQHMYHRRPERTDSVVISGCGWSEVKEFAPGRIAAYQAGGLGYRADYALESFGKSFRTTPLSKWLVDLWMERNATADLDSILRMFAALGAPDPEWLSRELRAPTLVIRGSEDYAVGAQTLADRIPNAEFVELAGAGHACHLEQPWVFDAEVLRFLRANGHHDLPAESSFGSSSSRTIRG